MNLHEILEKWMMTDRDATPLWKIAIGEIEYDAPDDPADGVEIAALAENIRQCGLIHPILVDRQNKGKKYRLIAGRRRLEAIRLLGRTHISAILVKSECISPLKIALSENLMRKESHYLDRAISLQTLLKTESIEELSRLFSVKVEVLQRQLSFAQLSPYEKRLVRLIKLSEEEALELCKIENSTLRKLLLEKMAESGDQLDRAKLIKNAIESPDFRLTQSEKILVRDIRVFLNSVERAAELMASAGFATDIKRRDEPDSYEFTIRVAKTQNAPLDKRPSNVSRETSEPRSNEKRCKIANVSRETSEIPLCAIDESGQP